MRDGGCLNAGRSRPVRKRGLTLVEVLITLALIALLAGAIVLGPGMLTSSRQRAAATLIMSGVRLGMTRANVTGYPVRMVFDLEQDRIQLEQSASRSVLRASPDGGAPRTATAIAENAEAEAQAEAERVTSGTQKGPAQFKPVEEFGFDGDDPKTGRGLGSGVFFGAVQTERDEAPITEGRAYLYFWPRGGTERAAVHINRGEEEGGLTVMISALTGRARIEKGRVDLPPPRWDDEDYSEREEE